MKHAVVLFAFHNAGEACLSWLAQQENIMIPFVVTHKPYKGENVWFASVEEAAKKLGIQVLIAEEHSSEEIERGIKKACPDAIFSINYRKIIPRNVYITARIGAFNLHDSLLPSYKGFAPQVWAMINGEVKTGVTLHAISDDVDAGDIVSQVEVPITSQDKIGDLLVRLSEATKELFIETLPRILSENYPRRAQKPTDGFFMNRRTTKDDYIDWNQPVDRIINFVRAVSPPVAIARTRLGNFEVLIKNVSSVNLPASEKQGEPGQVLSSSSDGGICVQAVNGTIKITDYSLADESTKAKPIKPGMCFS